MSNLPVIRHLEPQLQKQLLQEYEGERSGFVQVGEEKWLLPMKYEKFVDELWNFEVRPDDTWIVTFPRSGTTVISELIWLVSNNLDFETAKKKSLPQRFTFIEINLFIHEALLKEVRQENSSEGQKLLKSFDVPGWEVLKKAASPRFIKTHLPFQLLPKNLLTCGAKVVYVARNPKDAAISSYYLYRMVRFHGYIGELEKFWNDFEKGLALYAPYWDHVIEGWNNRNNPNLQFIFYEEYCKNPSETILKISKFLNKNLTQDQVNQMVDHLQFDNFKKNEAVNNANMKNVKILKESEFVRKGKTGGWINEFTPELLTKADKWIEENLGKTDLKFPLQ